MAIIGIDLGTTNSLACVYKETGPELIPNAYGSFITPSAVAIDNGEITVGLPAKKMLLDAPENAASLFKRRMGSEERIRVGNKQFLPEELSSLVIGSIISDAERFLGEKIEEVSLREGCCGAAAGEEADCGCGKDFAFVTPLIDEGSFSYMSAAFDRIKSIRLL